MATSTAACRKRGVPQPLDGFQDDHLVDDLVKMLSRRFQGCATTEEYAAFAREAVEHFSGAAVSNFLPILAQRHALAVSKAHCANRTSGESDAAQ